ncbi:uncharacterized [Tachysurus ichikawai]
MSAVVSSSAKQSFFDTCTRLSLHIREVYLVQSVDIGVDISIGTRTNEPVQEGFTSHGRLVRCGETERIHAKN